MKLTSYERKVEKYRRPTPKIEGIVTVTELSSLGTSDMRLLSAFVER